MSGRISEPISHYDIFRGQKKIAEVAHQPQTTRRPFTFRDTDAPGRAIRYRVRAVDKRNNKSVWAETSIDGLAGA